MYRLRVGIVGATGAVGQKFVQLLTGTGPMRYDTETGEHPWFTITALAASQQSSGKRYGDIYRQGPPDLLPEHVREMRIATITPDLPCDVLLSGLDSAVAGPLESELACAGFPVISNARNHRWDPDVPLLIPEVNPDHISLIERQTTFSRGGFIVTNPNCAAVGLAMAVKPLHDRFGVRQVAVVTMQAISGAGYPGVASLDITDNVVPFIGDEEEKLESELGKILGSYDGNGWELAPITISASCNRVPVLDGHLECAFVKLGETASPDAIVNVWQQFRARPQDDRLPSAPAQPVQYFFQERYPQPRLHRDLHGGMVTSVGRLRACSLFDYKFVLLSHNTIRGAAGGALLNAELLCNAGYLKRRA